MVRDGVVQVEDPILDEPKDLGSDHGLVDASDVELRLWYKVGHPVGGPRRTGPHANVGDDYGRYRRVANGVIQPFAGPGPAGFNGDGTLGATGQLDGCPELCVNRYG